MAKNSNMNSAKKAKNDEFYTVFTDIEAEMCKYFKEIKGKNLTIICNCDDPFESNFFKYFTLQFHNLGLKRLIGISYAGSPIAGKTMKKVYGDAFNIDTENHGYVVDVNKYVWTPTEGFDWDIAMQQIKDFPENKLIQLEGDGSFQSEESIEYLKQADLVTTNPPFSQFQEFITLLAKYNKKFIVLGNKNAITYKEIFPMIKENKLWLGINSPKEFILPEGNATKKVSGLTRWFTNIAHNKRHDILGLSKSYYIDTELFPSYDNYAAIEVNKVKNIPWDYPGVMGVPITFLDKWNPDQFEIVGSLNASSLAEKGAWGYVYSTNTPTIISGKEKMWNGPVVNKIPKYKRIVIKNKLVDTTTEEWKRNYQNYQNRMKVEEITNENNA